MSPLPYKVAPKGCIVTVMLDLRFVILTNVLGDVPHGFDYILDRQ